MTSTFTLLDAVVLLVYLVGTTALGMWLGRHQKDARDYFVADRAIPWWAVLFSVVATETSALTFISIPGLAYLADLSFLQVAIGYLLGRIVVGYTLLPRYYEGELVTAYTLLQRRFGLATRRFASIIFMVTRAFGDSVRVFATAIPVALIMGPVIDPRYLMPVSILILGAFTIVYTYHGGMRAVVWTDVMQTFVYLFGGIAAVWLLGRGVEGGWSAILDQAGSLGKLRVFDTYTGFDRAHTVFAGFIGGAFSPWPRTAPTSSSYSGSWPRRHCVTHAARSSAAASPSSCSSRCSSSSGSACTPIIGHKLSPAPTRFSHASSSRSCHRGSPGS